MRSHELRLPCLLNEALPELQQSAGAGEELAHRQAHPGLLAAQAGGSCRCHRGW